MNEISRAMMMMIVAMLILPGIDAIAKWLSSSISSGQATWARFFFQLVLLFPLFLRCKGGSWLISVMVVHDYRHAPVSLLAPFQYVEIVGATVLGLVIFSDFPDLTTWIGVSVIVSSGVYVFHRESSQNR